MAARTTIQVSGLRELGQKMHGLGDKVAKQLARRATGKAANVIKKAAIQKVVTNPSIETGSLRDAIIAKKLGKSESRDTSAHIVAVRIRGSRRKSKGKARKQATAPYAPLVEFGTVKMQAEPFMRPAFDNNKQRALDVMVDTLRTGIAEKL